MGIRRLTIFTVLGLLLTLAAATAVGVRAVAPTPPPVPTAVTLLDAVLDGPGVVKRDVSQLPPLANARMEVVQGTRAVDGACRFQPVFTASNGDMRTQVVRQIAFDPTTCRFQIERGTALSAPPAPPARATAEATGGK